MIGLTGIRDRFAAEQVIALHGIRTNDVERAVFVEACQDGWNPRTVVRQLVWRGDAIHEELTVFPWLREALAYAQQAFLTQDRPEPSPA